MIDSDWKDFEVQCPKCVIIADDEIKKAKDDLQVCYGQITQKEYNTELKQLEELKRLKKNKEISIFNTLRENYSIGFCGTLFKVSYKATCPKCGFKFEHNHKIRMR